MDNHIHDHFPRQIGSLISSRLERYSPQHHGQQQQGKYTGHFVNGLLYLLFTIHELCARARSTDSAFLNSSITCYTSLSIIIILEFRLLLFMYLCGLVSFNLNNSRFICVMFVMMSIFVWGISSFRIECLCSTL